MKKININYQPRILSDHANDGILIMSNASNSGTHLDPTMGKNCRIEEGEDGVNRRKWL